MKSVAIRKILFLVIFWVCCTVFIISYEAAYTNFESSIVAENYSYARNLVAGIVVTIIGAILLGSLEVFVLSNKLRRLPFGMALLAKTAIYLCFILLFSSLLVSYTISAELQRPIFSYDTMYTYYHSFLISPKLLMTVIYWGGACFAGLFVLQSSDKFGQGVLVSFLLGKYHKPKEERHIFMFMDLKSSTTYAERLGHVKYSQLIQDCFYDVNEIISKHDATVYQYVGDEVVLEWDLQKGIQDGNCIRTYFSFQKLLKNKSDYYQSKYGFVPKFKAGINEGIVTAAEVGIIKKELAYHGDVMNTASRIQEMCNKVRKKILLSESLKTQLERMSSLKFDFIGRYQLRGKGEEVNIYSVISPK